MTSRHSAALIVECGALQQQGATNTRPHIRPAANANAMPASEPERAVRAARRRCDQGFSQSTPPHVRNTGNEM
jgi:hypothetical protein